MRRAFILVFGAVIAVAVLFGLLWDTKGARAMSIKFNIKDMPEHGLTLIGPSEPSFDSLLAALMKGKPHVPAELLRPYSVFIKNKGKKDVVAYKLRWECAKRDGTTIFKDSSTSSAWVLMNWAGPDHERAVAEAGQVVRKNSVWFYSLKAPPQPMEATEEDTDADGGWHAIAGAGEAAASPGRARAAEEADAIRLLNAELQTYTAITVSLDAVVFDDGTFAGPDTSGFLGAVRAEIDARYDLLREMQMGLQGNKKADDIFAAVEAAAAQPAVDIGPESTPPDYYQYFRKRYAEEFLGYRQSMGSERALRQALRQLDKEWTKLKKI